MSIWSAEIKELEKLYESLRGQLPDLEKELVRLIKTDDENIVLVYSRRCLEIIVTDLCECELKRPRKTEPLQGIIDKLNKEEKVPSHIIASMHGLNELSTFGAHPKEFDPRQVKPVLYNLTIIIDWYLKYRKSHTVGKIKAEEAKPQYREPFEEVRKEERKEVQRRPAKLPKHKLLSGIFITAILVIVAIIAYPRIFKRDIIEKLRSSGERISVAVMPFQNMTNDTTWNVWQNGIQDMIVTTLSNSPDELLVRQTESINDLIKNKGFSNYASITPSFASTISQKLEADVFIYGNIKQAGSAIRVYAQLIDSKTEAVFKSFQIEDSAKEENIFQVIDSLSTEVKNFLIISKLIKGETPDVKYAATTKYPEAFKCVISGNYAFFTKHDYPTAINMYLQAIAIDSNYIWPAIMISIAYYNQLLYEEGKKWCQRNYEKKDQMSNFLKTHANIDYACYYETPYEAIKCLKQLLEIDDQLPDVYNDIGYFYNSLEQYSRAIPELEKTLEIYEKWGAKPLWVVDYTHLGLAYHKIGQYKKEKKLYKRAELDFPDDPYIIFRQAVLALSLKDARLSNEYIKKFIAVNTENGLSETDINSSLGWLYNEAGNQDEAEEYFRQTLLFEPEAPDKINDLAWFLIDNDRNIDEGLKLIDTALQSNPDNYSFLHTKGLGLYKQGKYQEALEILQKSWDLRMKNAIYNHEAFLHLEAAKKVVASQKNN